MRHRQSVVVGREPKELGVKTLGGGILALVLLALATGLVYKEYKKSIVVTQNLRTTLAITTKDGQVGVVSYDPAEENISEIVLDDIEISSRSIGKYKLSHLYKLGEYEGKGGAFVKQKIQGFLRLPIVDYLVVAKLSPASVRAALWGQVWGRKNATMSRLDALALWYLSLKYSWHEIPFETLVKEGAIIKATDDYEINNTRLLQFVGNRFFDWQVGAEGTTVTVINETKVDGLASDVASFLTNVGMDVIAVRSGANERAKTQIKVSNSAKEKMASETVLKMIFGKEIDYLYDQDLSDYRSDVVVIVGEDVLSMY